MKKEECKMKNLAGWWAPKSSRWDRYDSAFELVATLRQAGICRGYESGVALRLPPHSITLARGRGSLGFDPTRSSFDNVTSKYIKPSQGKSSYPPTRMKNAARPGPYAHV